MYDPATLKQSKYEIEMTPQADAHLAALSGRDRATLVEAVAERLMHEPTVMTRNRKRLEENPLAPWVLRIGHLRVYYKVSDDPPIVTVRAIGMKDRSRVLIGGQEVKLR